MKSYSEDEVAVYARLHSVKNVVGVIGLIEELAGLKPSIEKKWAKLETHALKHQDYEFIAKSVQRLLEDTRHVIEQSSKQETRQTLIPLLKEVANKLDDIKEELLHPEKLIYRERAHFKSRLLNFINTLNDMSQPGTSLIRLKPDNPNDKRLVIDLSNQSYCYPLEFCCVIRNLIANARKYTEDGDTIILKMEQKPDGHLFLSVSDSGIGIPQDEIAQIGTPGFRASNNKKRGLGYGMGLTVVKRFADKYNGTLKFRSVEGEGTTVEMEAQMPCHLCE